MALVPVPAAFTTDIVPDVAPAGTVAVICVALFTVNVAAIPLKRTAVAPVKLVPVITTVPPAQAVVGVKLVIVGVVGIIGRNTSIIPALRSAADRVAIPAPVGPAVALIAHAPPTAALLLVRLSKNSVKVPIVAADHAENVGDEFAAIPNMTTAAFAVTVVLLLANNTVVEFCTDKFPEATSNGLAKSTPLNAAMVPTV